MKLTRRDLFKGIAGITGAGILLPGEEVARKFWPGWSVPAVNAAELATTDPFAHLDPRLIVFLLEDSATGAGRFATWTGRAFVPSLISGRAMDHLPIAIDRSGDAGSPATMGGFPVIDVTRYAIPLPEVGQGAVAYADESAARQYWGDGLIERRGNVYINAMTDKPAVYFTDNSLPPFPGNAGGWRRL